MWTDGRERSTGSREPRDQENESMSVRHLLRACIALLALGLPAAAPANDITVWMTPSSQDVVPGGSGYVLDFGMTTTSPIDLGGFNVTVTVPSASSITFTGGDSSVANYVFTGNLSGLFQFSNPIGPNSGNITDFPNTFDQPLAAGTYGLGEMFFSVASNAPGGSVNVTLDPATSFTQGVPPYNPYTYAPTGGSTIGTINVVASAIPEPSSALLLCVSVAAGGLVWLGKRLRGRLTA
jgi:hypothetical protein